MAGMATANFSWHELGDPPANLQPHAHHLAHHLERLRAICGDEPLQVISAYRTRRANQTAGGAKASQHLVALAADIPRGYATTDQAASAGFVGIGSSGPWAVHVDMRSGRRARWSY